MLDARPTSRGELGADEGSQTWLRKYCATGLLKQGAQRAPRNAGSVKCASAYLLARSSLATQRPGAARARRTPKHAKRVGVTRMNSTTLYAHTHTLARTSVAAYRRADVSAMVLALVIFTRTAEKDTRSPA